MKYIDKKNNLHDTWIDAILANLGYAVEGDSDNIMPVEVNTETLPVTAEAAPALNTDIDVNTYKPISYDDPDNDDEPDDIDDDDDSEDTDNRDPRDFVDTYLRTLGLSINVVDKLADAIINDPDSIAKVSEIIPDDDLKAADEDDIEDESDDATMYNTADNTQQIDVTQILTKIIDRPELISKIHITLADGAEDGLGDLVDTNNLQVTYVNNDGVESDVISIPSDDMYHAFIVDYKNHVIKALGSNGVVKEYPISDRMYSTVGDELLSAAHDIEDVVSNELIDSFVDHVLEGVQFPLPNTPLGQGSLSDGFIQVASEVLNKAVHESPSTVRTGGESLIHKLLTKIRFKQN